MNVRKCKAILIYDFQLEVEWQAIGPFDVSSGTFKIKDLMNDDDDFEILDLKADEEENSTFNKTVLNLIK